MSTKSLDYVIWTFRNPGYHEDTEGPVLNSIISYTDSLEVGETRATAESQVSAGCRLFVVKPIGDFSPIFKPIEFVILPPINTSGAFNIIWSDCIFIVLYIFNTYRCNNIYIVSFFHW